MFLKFLLRYNSLTIKLTVLFIYLLAVLDLHCCVGFSLVGVSGGLSSCSAWASQFRGFSCCRAQALGTWAIAVAARGLNICGSQALEHRLSGCGVWALVAPQHVGTFLDQGSNICLLLWQADSLPLSHQGSPKLTVLE